MSEQLSQPEYQININPYEKLVLDLLDNIKDGWTGNGTRWWITLKLREIDEGRFQVDHYGNMVDTWRPESSDTSGAINE